MQSKVLLWAIGIAVVAVIGVTYVMVQHTLRPEMPPLAGAMHKFKPTNPPVPEPPGSFVDADGTKLDLGAFKGKLTLVNFWATWCAPCVAELPSIERLKKAKASDKFAVATISEDQGGNVAVDGFFKKNGIVGLPEYLDSVAAYSETLKLAGLPTTILLDQSGRELGRYEGDTDWSGADAANLIDWYIAKSMPASSLGP